MLSGCRRHLAVTKPSSGSVAPEVPTPASSAHTALPLPAPPALWLARPSLWVHVQQGLRNPW